MTNIWYLGAGLPIATGVIEGACRHLLKDRPERTGMRWSTSGSGNAQSPTPESFPRMGCIPTAIPQPNAPQDASSASAVTLNVDRIDQYDVSCKHEHRADTILRDRMNLLREFVTNFVWAQQRRPIAAAHESLSPCLLNSFEYTTLASDDLLRDIPVRPGYSLWCQHSDCCSSPK